MRQMRGQERKGEFERDWWLNKREWLLGLFRTYEQLAGFYSSIYLKKRTTYRYAKEGPTHFI
jgi:hypothetical protein